MTTRIATIEKPSNPLMRLLFTIVRWHFGKVLGPLKVIYARKPALLLIARRMVKQANALSLPPALRALIQVQASRLNGCRFCEDVALAAAYQTTIGRERFARIADYRSSLLFTERERAALAFGEEATRHCKVSEETWALVKQHFSDLEIVELAWLNACENYFNLQAAVLEIQSDGLADMRVPQAAHRSKAEA